MFLRKMLKIAALDSDKRGKRSRNMADRREERYHGETLHSLSNPRSRMNCGNGVGWHVRMQNPLWGTAFGLPLQVFRCLGLVSTWPDGQVRLTQTEPSKSWGKMAKQS